MQLFEATRIVGISPTRRPIMETIQIRDMNDALTPGKLQSDFRFSIHVVFRIESRWYYLLLRVYRSFLHGPSGSHNCAPCCWRCSRICEYWHFLSWFDQLFLVCSNLCSGSVISSHADHRFGCQSHLSCRICPWLYHASLFIPWSSSSYHLYSHLVVCHYTKSLTFPVMKLEYCLLISLFLLGIDLYIALFLLFLGLSSFRVDFCPLLLSSSPMFHEILIDLFYYFQIVLRNSSI